VSRRRHSPSQALYTQPGPLRQTLNGPAAIPLLVLLLVLEGPSSTSRINRIDTHSFSRCCTQPHCLAMKAPALPRSAPRAQTAPLRSHCSTAEPPVYRASSLPTALPRLTQAAACPSDSAGAGLITLRRSRSRRCHPHHRFCSGDRAAPVRHLSSRRPQRCKGESSAVAFRRHVPRGLFPPRPRPLGDCRA
jgi:hypothetical protein